MTQQDQGAVGRIGWHYIIEVVGETEHDCVELAHKWTIDHARMLADVGAGNVAANLEWPSDEPLTVNRRTLYVLADPASCPCCVAGRDHGHLDVN